MPSKTHSPFEQSELPKLPEQVTVAWLTKVMGQNIKAVELTKSVLAATTGKLFLTLTYGDDNTSLLDSTEKSNIEPPKPSKVCIKGGFNPEIIETYSDIVVAVYKHEASFFNNVAPSLTHIDLPKSYWAGNNANQGIIIMDDLNALGAEFGEPTHPWSVERVLAGVEQLAGLHAETWGAKQADHPWIQPMHFENTINAMADNWDDMIYGANRPPLPEYLKDQKRMRALFEKNWASRNPRFRCLIHGDCHIGNTYLIKGAPRFLDWQTIHVGSCFHDVVRLSYNLSNNVAYFVSGSLTVEDRRANETRILDHYLEVLSRLGGPSLSRADEDVWVEYRKSVIAGYVWILAPYEFQNEARVRAMVERLSTAILDHKTVELLESLPDVE